MTCLKDVLHVLSIEPPEQKATQTGATEAEQLVLDLIGKGVTDGSDLDAQSNLEIEHFNQTLTMLEITGKIRNLGANQWSL